MTELRSVWLVTHLGVPKRLQFAMVKNPSEEPDSDLHPLNCALTAAEEADSDWDATPTVWRRAPAFAYPGILTDAAASATLTGRILNVAGVEWDLDSVGRADATAGAEPLEPDGIVVDATAAVVLAEALGQDLAFNEKTTLKKIKLHKDTDPSIVTPVGVNSALHRQSSDGLVIRVEE
ncbi:MAG: hypothetical protein ACXABY_08085 [Candidatus Thorarchaeota archaeon]|jgi:hypothetical protein